MQKLAGTVRRCIDDYNMINDGDRIAVGVSGGKDSVVLLNVLNFLRRFYPAKFELCAVTVDMGIDGTDYSPIALMCRNNGIKYEIIKTDIAEIVFNAKCEKHPCSLCAKMRRGALINYLKENEYNKLALGHHHDDAVETFLLNLLYEAKIGCFEPKTIYEDTGITLIRPMLYVGEGTVRNTAQRLNLPIVKNICPNDGKSKREEAKQLVKKLSAEYPDIKDKIFTAMQRTPLPAWKAER